MQDNCLCIMYKLQTQYIYNVRDLVSSQKNKRNIMKSVLCMKSGMTHVILL